jgi:predicted ATP-dependent endonuclease of OLD family
MKLSIGETFFKRLILIDEPNTFLHSLAQINLLNYFKSIITKNDCKLIYTTHSEHLVDSEIPIIYKNKNN